jgi:glycine/D-amino acid oxidase-like deaminating enzyme
MPGFEPAGCPRSSDTLSGKIFADLIVHGDTDIDLTPYRLKRFSDPANL